MDVWLYARGRGSQELTSDMDSATFATISDRRHIAKALGFRFDAAMPQQDFHRTERLREHLEQALAEAEALDWTIVVALISEALDALVDPLSTTSE